MDSLSTKNILKVKDRNYVIFNLKALSKLNDNIEYMPFSLKILQCRYCTSSKP